MIGLAKDGRVIYGPKLVDSKGAKTLVTTCDVDVCNGKIETVN